MCKAGKLHSDLCIMRSIHADTSLQLLVTAAAAQKKLHQCILLQRCVTALWKLRCRFALLALGRGGDMYLTLSCWCDILIGDDKLIATSMLQAKASFYKTNVEVIMCIG